jgi:hypothetical protein
MIRNSIKMTALAAVALLGSTVAFNCSKGGSSSDSIGHVNLALTLPSGVHINTVHYDIHAGTPATITDATGNINTTDVNATPTAFVSFPASTGDTVTLTADTTATPPVHCTGTSMPFAVIAGAEAQASVVLLCGGGQLAGQGNLGNVHIVGTVSESPGTGDNCPQLTSWTVSPLQTSAPAGTIDVAADATDADPGETATLSFAWAPAAKFTTPTGKTDTYHCLTAGPDTITLTVTDTHTPSACTETIQFAVNCVATGTTGAAGATAGAGGGAAGATAGAGGGAAGATAGAGGGAAGATAGAGGGAAGAGGGAAGATAGAGGGAAGAGGGTAGAGGSGGLISASCNLCQQTNTLNGICSNTFSPTSDPTNIMQFGCNGFTGTAKSTCESLLVCLLGTTCKSAIAAADVSYGEAGLGNDDPYPCLCGNIDKGTCNGKLGAGESTLKPTVPPNPNTGVCAQQFFDAAAAQSTTCATVAPGQPGCVSVIGSTSDPAFGMGVAVSSFVCDVDGNNPAFGGMACTCP